MPIRWRIGRDPYWDEFNRIQKNLGDLFSVLSGTTGRTTEPLWSGAKLFPLLNVVQEDDKYTVTAELPGLNKKDIDIKIEGDTLGLKGERKPYDAGKDVSYHRRERAVGTFQRSLTLPAKIDPETVKANYKDGVLTITLYKEKAVLPKQITVSTEE